MRGAWLAATLLAALFAGCAGDEGTTTQDQEPCVVESADDYTCADADLNKTADQVAHLHDYWRGQTTVRLLEEEKSLGNPVIRNCDAYPMVSWLPPDGSTVYQGTGVVDITTRVEYRPDHQSGPLEIWVKRADQDRATYVAQLEDGNTVSMEINLSAADLPHQKLSAWEFWVYATHVPALEDAYCMVQPRGTVTFEVDIHKTLEVPLFPGHPDHWGDATDLPLLDSFANFGWAEEWLGSCTSGNGGSSHPDGSCDMHWRGFGPLNGSFVPPGAQVVRLTLTGHPAQGQPATQFGLLYHGADTREFVHVGPVARNGDEVVYEISVDSRDDGPYAKQSQWRFWVVNESDHRIYRGGWTLDGSVARV